MHGLTPECVYIVEEIRGGQVGNVFMGEDRYSSQLYAPYWLRHLKMADILVSIFLEDYINDYYSCFLTG